MASIGSIIEQFKNDPSRALEHLPFHQVCEQLQLKWRERCLAPATSAALFIRQIIHGNSSCAKVRHLGDRQFSAQAYCKARGRLPLEVIRRLSRGLCDAARRQRQSQTPDHGQLGCL